MLISSVHNLIERLPFIKIYGVVQSIQGLLVRVQCNNNQIRVGKMCRILSRYAGDDRSSLLAEVVGFDEKCALVMPYGFVEEIQPGAQVDFSGEEDRVYPTANWLGRVLNGLGEPLDGKGFLPQGNEGVLLRQSPPVSHKRQKVTERLDVGVRAINTFLTACKGQRLGIFSGSGVGKSMLLSMLARFTACDVCVIGLIGERGREVREFIEDTLGEEGLQKSVLVVATSDESPLMRRRAAYQTLAVAEYFRDQGKSVLCLVDSMTRFAMAQREIGLSVGEPPTAKGYTPSVFVELARLMERAGPGVTDSGMITAFFTVLVDGDDHNEPIADAVRGILDGHIVLDRTIAERGHYPAIHILRSISRMVPACHAASEQDLIRKARQILSLYENMSDMIRLGAYRAGSNPELDKAISIHPQLMEFLAQNHQHRESLDQSFSMLERALGR